MKVKLISYTHNQEELIAASDKLCYSKVGVEEITQKMDSASIEKFLNMLMGFSHNSPLEHASFSFAVEGVSRALSHQLVRHRIASYSQQSQRYVRLEDFEYITPPAIKENKKAREIYDKIMQLDKKAYEDLCSILIDQKAAPLIKAGMEEQDARKKVEKEALEDARYIFPNACETKLVFTMNVRSLLHFFELRTCNRAQWEIRHMAELMLIELKRVSPILFKKAGPSCLNGPCPEGKMTCGKINEVREHFRSL